MSFAVRTVLCPHGRFCCRSKLSCTDYPPFRSLVAHCHSCPRPLYTAPNVQRRENAGVPAAGYSYFRRTLTDSACVDPRVGRCYSRLRESPAPGRVSYFVIGRIFYLVCTRFEFPLDKPDRSEIYYPRNGPIRAISINGARLHHRRNTAEGNDLVAERMHGFVISRKGFIGGFAVRFRPRGKVSQVGRSGRRHSRSPAAVT
jgi:hypothetical protein